MQKAILVLIILWGFILRLYGLDFLPIWLDESISILAAKSVLAHGIPLLPSGNLYLSGLPQSYVLAAIGGLFSLFTNGWQLYLMRLPSVLIGTAIIPVVYYIVSKEWNYRVGLLAAAFVAFNYYQIAWSRQARMYIFLELFLLLAIYYLWQFFQNRKQHDGIYAFIFSVLSILTHPGGLLIVPIAALLLGLHYRTLKKPQLITLTILFTVLAVYFGVRQLMSLTLSNFFLMHLSWLQTAYLPILIIGALAILLGWRERFLIGVVLLQLIYVSFFSSLYAHRYTIHIIPIIAILAFVFLDTALEWKWMYFVLGALLIVFSSSLFIPTNEIYLEPDTPQPPWDDVYNYVAQQQYSLILDESTYIERKPIVDAHPVIAHYYGINVDGWLNSSLTGRRAKQTHDGYLGIPLMKPQGLVVMDVRAWQTIDTRPLRNATYEEFGDEHWRIARVYTVEQSPLPLLQDVQARVLHHITTTKNALILSS